MTKGDATGGEMYEMWRIANKLFPTASDAYYEECKTLHEVTGNRDEEELGRAIPRWSTLAQELENAMYYSALSLGSASSALNQAITEYAYVDGQTANKISEATEGLTDAGKELKDDIGDTEQMTADIPWDYDGPRDIDLPWDWDKVHDEK